MVGKKIIRREKRRVTTKVLTHEDIEDQLEGLERENKREERDLSSVPVHLEFKDIKYIREDVARGNPEEYKGVFPFRELQKRKWWQIWKIFSADEEEDYTKGNNLLLMDNDGGFRIFNNVSVGIFEVKDFEGTDKERSDYIILKPNKLRSYMSPEGVIERWWVCDINNAVALPDEPLYSTKTVGEAIRQAVTDKQKFETTKKKKWWEEYMWVIPAILIVGYFLWYFGLLDGIISSFSGSGATESATTSVAGSNVQNVAGGTVSGG